MPACPCTHLCGLLCYFRVWNVLSEWRLSIISGPLVLADSQNAIARKKYKSIVTNDIDGDQDQIIVSGN